MVNFNEKCAGKIVACLQRGEETTEEQTEVLVYGYTLLLENLYKTLILIAIACLTHTIRETCIIIGSFAALRSCAGGIHCKGSLGCTASMLGIWGLGLIVAHVSIPVPMLAILLGITIWIIVRYAPRSTQNNPIVDEGVRRRKKIGSIGVVAAMSVAGGICYGLGEPSVLNMILTSMFLEAFSILLLKEKEGDRYEKAGC